MAKKSKAVKVSSSESESGTPRLQELYSNTVRPALAEELSRKNPHSIPRLEKIVVNMGVGTAVTEKKHLEEAMAALGQIAGQKPVATLSRKAVAGLSCEKICPLDVK
jgi:large subunit ribosomal protein L5